MAYDNRYDNDDYNEDYGQAQPHAFHTTTPPLGPVPLSNSPSTFPPPVPNKNGAYFDSHQASSYATRPASNDLGGYSNHARAKTEGSASEDGMVSHTHADGGGKTRRKSGWRGLSCFSTRNQIAFLSVILVQALVILTMIALVYATVNNAIGPDVPVSETFKNDPKLESVSTYLGLFILAELFEIFVALDALQAKNIMQLAFLIPFQLAITAYSAVLPFQLYSAIHGSAADVPYVQKNVRIYAIVIPSVSGAVTLVMSWLIWRLYEEYGWAIYKKIGADISLKRQYFRYQVFVCLLKFDAFFFVGFSIQFLVLVSLTPIAEKVITIVALPIILVCLVLAAVVIRLESRPGTYVWFFLQFLGLAYFLYKLIRIYDPTSGDRYSTAKSTLTIFSIISFLMLLLTFITTGLCYANFGRGLKEAIPPFVWRRQTRPRKEVGGEGNLSNGHGGGGGDDGRMSLD